MDQKRLSELAKLAKENQGFVPVAGTDVKALAEAVEAAIDAQSQEELPEKQAGYVEALVAAASQVDGMPRKQPFNFDVEHLAAVCVMAGGKPAGDKQPAGKK